MTNSTGNKSQVFLGCGVLAAIVAVLVAAALVTNPFFFWSNPLGRLVSDITTHIRLILRPPPQHPRWSDLYSSTRGRMQNLKSGLVCYANDVGRYPHTGEILSSSTLLLADKFCLDTSTNRNVLVNPKVGPPFGFIDPEKYAKRWKGPYMDCDPTEFMLDAWGKRILYRPHGNGVWLQSAGEDGIYDVLASATVASYTGDDEVMSIAKLKQLSSPRPITPPPPISSSPGDGTK